ncbi:MAG TPA: hypothetical protein VHT91_14680 [Kofleriaceae bacterium]|jgi:hypothetical protein|nr:hypothetical protein [Kofleriaceae bacterium]
MSAPRSLQLNCKATGNGGQAALNVTLPANGKTHMHLELDYKLHTYTFTDGSQAMGLFQIDDNGIRQISLVDGANTAWFVNIANGKTDGASAIAMQPSQDPTLDSWTHGVMDVEFSTTAGAVTFKWNATTMTAGLSNIRTTADSVITTVGVNIELLSIDATSPDVTMLIDNVTVDLL